MDELKPCPFCGGEASPVVFHNKECTWVRHYVKCNRCLTTTDKFEEREIAIEAWNRMASDGNEA